MDYEHMINWCKLGGKARRASWTSDAVVFIEGIVLGVTMTIGGRLVSNPYHSTVSDREADDWRIA